MIKKAVVLCGGMATRFLPVSKTFPKELFPILTKPIIQYIVEELSESGVRDILFVIAKGKESVVSHFEKNTHLEERLRQSNRQNELDEIQKISRLANISFVYQLSAKGTGDALLQAQSFVGDDNFIMLFGDELFFTNKLSRTQQMLNFFKDFNSAVIATAPVPHEQVFKYGIVGGEKISPDVLRLRQIVEKPKVEDAPSNLSYIGPAILNKNIFVHIKNTPLTKGEVYLTDSFQLMCKTEKMFALTLDGVRLDCGTVEEFVKTNIFMSLQNSVIAPNILEYISNITKKNG